MHPAIVALSMIFSQHVRVSYLTRSVTMMIVLSDMISGKPDWQATRPGRNMAGMVGMPARLVEHLR